jgi:hypothetical protein
MPREHAGQHFTSVFYGVSGVDFQFAIRGLTSNGQPEAAPCEEDVKDRDSVGERIIGFEEFGADGAASVFIPRLVVTAPQVQPCAANEPVRHQRTPVLGPLAAGAVNVASASNVPR